MLANMRLVGSKAALCRNAPVPRRAGCPKAAPYRANLQFFLYQISKNNRIVMRFILCPVNQRERAFFRELDQMINRRTITRRQFGTIAFYKLLPAINRMPKPATKLIARRTVLQPVVNLQLLFGYASGPESINQNPVSTIRIRLMPVIGSLQLNRMTHDIASSSLSDKPNSCLL